MPDNMECQMSRCLLWWWWQCVWEGEGGGRLRGCVYVCVMVVGGGAAVEMPLAQASACIPSFDRRASQHVGALTFESLRTPDDEV